MNQDYYDERLSTIYESPSPQPRTEDEEDIYDDAYDKLIVYDIANVKSNEKVNRYHFERFIFFFVKF